MLFYTQQRDQLDSAIHAGLSPSNGTHAKAASTSLGAGFKPVGGAFRPPLAPGGLVNGMNGKRKHDADGDAGSPPKRPFIGPQRPGPSLSNLSSALPNASSPPPPRLPQTSPQDRYHSSSRPPSSDDLHGKYGVPSVRPANFYGSGAQRHQPQHQQHRHGGNQNYSRHNNRGGHGRGRGGGGGHRRY